MQNSINYVKNKQVKQNVNGKEITVEINQINQPNIELIAKGILSATKKGC
ncbi:hypothetical protein ACTWQB_01925 [Piscibacillus sp. B03]